MKLETWMPDRVHRLKNVLAFLFELQEIANLKGDGTIECLSPEVIESIYLKYLGPDLPTIHEYSVRLNGLAITDMENYCNKWATKDE